jgi:hypothetical protein
VPVRVTIVFFAAQLERRESKREKERKRERERERERERKRKTELKINMYPSAIAQRARGSCNLLSSRVVAVSERNEQLMENQ